MKLIEKVGTGQVSGTMVSATGSITQKYLQLLKKLLYHELITGYVKLIKSH
jgi:hypothetical protein